MLRYVLICIAAFMFIYERNQVQAGSLYPSHLLQEVADFDDIIEPNPIQDPASNIIKTRASNNEAKVELLSKNEVERCPHCRGDYPQKTLLDRIKRELDRVGTIFVNQFLGNNEDTERRRKRGFKIIAEPLNEDEDEEEKCDDGKEGKKNISKADQAFNEEQTKAENITANTKEWYDEIEHPPFKSDADVEQQCCASGDYEEKPKQVKPTNRKKGKAEGKPKGSIGLKVHYYKPVESSKNLKLSASDDKSSDKSLSINLYPEHKKAKVVQTPEKYDYIALLSKDNSLVRIPAIKFTVVPEVSYKKRHSENFEPFYISKCGQRLQHLKFEPTNNLFHVTDYSTLDQGWTHVPILFINTVRDLHSRENRRSRKRSNYGVPENTYLRDVDLLIQKVNTSLKMGVTDEKRTDAGILVNSKIQNEHSIQPAEKTFEKSVEQMINEEYPAVARSNFMDSLEEQNDLGSSRSMTSGMNRKEALIRNELNLLQLSPNKFRPFDKNRGKSKLRYSNIGPRQRSIRRNDNMVVKGKNFMKTRLNKNRS